MEMTQSLDGIARRIDTLHGWADECRRVDMVHFNELHFFMYMDDSGYKNVPAELKSRPLTPQEKRMILAGNYRKTDLAGLAAGGDVNAILLQHYWKHGLEFTYIDVGCPYGISAITVAHLIRGCGRKNKVVCFEAGRASGLIDMNIKLNRIEKHLVFERQVVSDASIPLIMSAAIEHTEGNRVVNRDPKREDRSFAVDAISLDDYASQRALPGQFILKIDTEGSEYEIYQGMQTLLRDRITTAIMEFTPEFLVSRVKPADFLSELAGQATIVDLGQERLKDPARVIDGDFEGFVRDTTGRPNRWTDILVVPFKLPGQRALIDNLLALGGRPAAAPAEKHGHCHASA